MHGIVFVVVVIPDYFFKLFTQVYHEKQIFCSSTVSCCVWVVDKALEYDRTGAVQLANEKLN